MLAKSSRKERVICGLEMNIREIMIICTFQVVAN